MNMLIRLLMISSLAVAGGCGTAIKEGAGKAFGPEGNVTPLQPPTLSQSYPLREYSRFELGEFTNDLASQLPLIAGSPALFARTLILNCVGMTK